MDNAAADRLGRTVARLLRPRDRAANRRSDLELLMKLIAADQLAGTIVWQRAFTAALAAEEVIHNV